MALRCGIVGVTGYTGIELLRLVLAHPRLEIGALTARSARRIEESWPGLAGLGLPPVSAFDPAVLQGCDVVFTAIPHAHAAEVVPPLVAAGKTVIDLSAHYRTSDEAVYGLVELNRERLPGATLVANPGCYPTATMLAALPLRGHTDFLSASCLSGVSGAGRKPNARNLYCETADSAVAYGVSGAHRHNLELKAHLGIPTAFTPHLAPLNRGMLATVVARTTLTQGDVDGLYAEFYASSPLVTLRDEPPATNQVRGTARAHVFASVDEGVVTSICAIDNLMKGASAQAVQNLNVMQGWPEDLGLPLLPWSP